MQTTPGRSSPITGLRVTTLGIAWLAIVYVTHSALGLYYERLAVLYSVPPLGLIYAHCLSHRGRATAVLAVMATVVAVLIVGFAFVFPKGSAV